MVFSIVGIGFLVLFRITALLQNVLLNANPVCSSRMDHGRSLGILFLQPFRPYWANEVASGAGLSPAAFVERLSILASQLFVLLGWWS